MKIIKKLEFIFPIKENNKCIKVIVINDDPDLFENLIDRMFQINGSGYYRENKYLTFDLYYDQDLKRYQKSGGSASSANYERVRGAARVEFGAKDFHEKVLDQLIKEFYT